ncbi:hypothetical protein NEHOM01_2486, partial [Nematocida homosporus]|uniref:uncharacterized protein n=1 Tax=Nematocida homosporus TaxID=1912981 RepID=UPI002220E763
MEFFVFGFYSMHKQSEILPNKLIRVLFIVLGLLKISIQNPNAYNPRLEEPKGDSFTLGNGLKYLVIAQQNSPTTHVSISIKKCHYTTSNRDKNLSRLLEELLKHKIKPENNKNNQKWEAFLSKPKTCKIISSANFITIEFFLDNPTNPIPFELLRSVIVSQPTPEIIAQAKKQCLSNSQLNSLKSLPSDTKIIEEWNKTFCFPNIRLAVVTPSNRPEILGLLHQCFPTYHKDLDQKEELRPIMYQRDDITPYHLANPPQVVMYPKQECYFSPSEKTTITLIVPLIDAIRANNMQSLSDLYHLLHCSNKIYTDYHLTHSSNAIHIKNISLTSLETMLGIEITMEVDDAANIQNFEALDLVEGFFRAIKASYKQPDSVLHQSYKERMASIPETTPSIVLDALANLASIQMFFIAQGEIVDFVFAETPYPGEIANLDDLLDIAMNRENWYVSGKLNQAHWWQLTGKLANISLVRPIPKATKQTEQTKNIICLGTSEVQQDPPHATLANQQVSSTDLNEEMSPSVLNDSTRELNEPSELAKPAHLDTPDNQQQVDWNVVLNDKETELLFKFIQRYTSEDTESNVSNNPQELLRIHKSPSSDKYELSSLGDDEFVCCLDTEWSTDNLEILLTALNKFSKIRQSVSNIRILKVDHANCFLILSKYLSLLELPPSQPNTHIYLNLFNEDPANCMPWTTNKVLQETFRSNIQSIDKPKYSIHVTLLYLTASIQEIISPLLAHFKVSLLNLYTPLTTEINFLDNITWASSYSLFIDIQQPNTTVTLPSIAAPSNRGPGTDVQDVKNRLSWRQISILTVNLSGTNLKPQNITVLNLDDYLASKSASSGFDPTLSLSYDVL